VTSAVPPIRSERLELVSLSLPIIQAILAADADGTPFRVPTTWPDAHDRRFLELRVRDLQHFPQLQEWLVRAVVRDGEMIGHAGFHGPPGVNALKAPDAVEIGYTTFEPYRRNGYAAETARALIDWAAAERGIEHFVASVAPDNEPSLRLVRGLGFEQTGSRVDPEDGEEHLFELWRQ
jgi:ribosomal-protein-alanine N-acetyltransferase